MKIVTLAWLHIIALRVVDIRIRPSTSVIPIDRIRQSRFVSIVLISLSQCSVPDSDDGLITPLYISVRDPNNRLIYLTLHTRELHFQFEYI
jgi:hypothetical protein